MNPNTESSASRSSLFPEMAGYGPLHPIAAVPLLVLALAAGAFAIGALATILPWWATAGMTALAALLCRCGCGTGPR